MLMANSTEPRTRRSREEQPRKSQIANRKSYIAPRTTAYKASC